MANKNKPQGEKVEMASKAPENNNAKITGNPNDTIKNAAENNPTQQTAQFNQVIDENNMDMILIQKLREASQTAYNFSVKYSEMPGDFKKLGDAFASYAQVCEQRIQMQAQRNKRPPA